jgi:uncharacterized protein (DUF1697 family)
VKTTACVALLRGINLGSKRRVAMSDLRELGEAIGLEEVRTLLQSGNMTFRTSLSREEVEATLEREAKKALGLQTDFFVRSSAQWRSIIDRNPFEKEAKTDPSHLLVMVCKDPQSKSVKVGGAKGELVRPSGREIYIVYPHGIAGSRLKIDARGTARNWNTVLKLQKILEP